MSETKEPCLILLLDDDEDDYILVKAALHEAFGDKVKLDWFQRDHFSTMMICSGMYKLSLVDYRLGMEDGLMVIHKAKSNCQTQKVILVSAWADGSLAEKAKEIGADGYLNKSDLSEKYLKEAIEPLLECEPSGSTS